MAKRGAKAPKKVKAKAQPTKTKPAIVSYPKLPPVWQIVQQAVNILWDNRNLFSGVILVYGVLDLLLVRGFSAGTNVSTALKSHSLSSGINALGQLFGSSGNGNQGSAVWQLVLIIVVSLAIIWALRQVLAGVKIRIRDSYYRGMEPLIPFSIILFVILLQLIPLAIGAYLYSTVVAGGIAISAVERLGFGLIFIALGLVSFYFISSSVFALYIVTLPNMTPLKALRSAKDLVRRRRLLVIRKILGILLVITIAMTIVMLPIILIVSALAAWLFFFVGLVAILAIHCSMYTLYRELLHE